MKRAIHALHDQAGRTRAAAGAEGDDPDDSVVAESEEGACLPPAPHRAAHRRDAGGRTLTVHIGSDKDEEYIHCCTYAGWTK